MYEERRDKGTLSSAKLASEKWVVDCGVKFHSPVVCINVFWACFVCNFGMILGFPFRRYSVHSPAL